MTLDLISCAPIVHRNGTLWRYVRASMALVGFLPPLCDRLPPRQAAAAAAVAAARAGVPSKSPRASTTPGGDHPGRLHVLVDGGYVNNLPTDVMRAMGARVIVAVDVSGHGLPEARMKPWGDGLSGLSILLQQWLPSWRGCTSQIQLTLRLKAPGFNPS
jgi:lysophospholipid hydrolase